MDIDPIDGGPRPPVSSHLTAPPLQQSLAALHSGGGTALPGAATTEEEARQAIEMLRSDDLSARVAAAHRLDSVAAVLGEERTREVTTGRGYVFALTLDLDHSPKGNH
jgi:hypothetical protein